MQLKYHSARSKLVEAIKTLSIGKGKIQTRLLIVFDDLNALSNQDIPEEITQKWNEVNKLVTKYGPNGLVGSIEHTLSRITEPTGIRIAVLIYEMYYHIVHENTFTPSPK